MIKHTYFNPSKMWEEFSILKLGRVGMGRVLHIGPSWHGPSFKWAELAWAEMVLGRAVLHPPPTRVCFTNLGIKARETARISNRYNEVPHLSNTFIEGGKNVSICFLLS